MKFTVNNIIAEYPKLNVKLPKELNQEEYDFVKDNIDLYSKNEDIKKFIDAFVQKLNKVTAKPGKEKTEKKEQPKKSQPKKETTTKKVSKSKGTANKPKNAKPDPDPVEHFTLEERFMKRYLLLDGKTKTKDQVLNFIKSLQRAITEKKIRKTSKYKDVIDDIQNNLVSTYNATPNSIQSIKFSLAQKKVEELRTLVGNKKVRLSVLYIKRFIGLYGKESKEKVQKLHDLIEKAIEKRKIQKNDAYYDKIILVKKNLTNYLHKGNITINDAELRGLAGIAGEKQTTLPLGNPFKSSDVISSMELKQAVFRHMGFTGIWKKIIGDPEEPFNLMIYGSGGKGKSTFAIRFATYLSKELHRSVLYVADEEKISDKLKEKLQLFNAYNNQLEVTGILPKSLKGYDIVFFDSVTSMAMEPEDLEQLKEDYPNISFIYILQTNKQGSFYGKKKWQHLCDTAIRFEDGVVNVEKNRFGKIGEHSVNR